MSACKHHWGKTDFQTEANKRIIALQNCYWIGQISESQIFIFSGWAELLSNHDFLALQPDALYQFYISVAMRIAIQLLWFLLLVCVFWEFSCRCIKKLSHQETEVCLMERYMSSGKCFRPPQKREKNPTIACFCVFLALFRYPHDSSSENWLLHCEGRKKKTEKVVIMGILFEFLASFMVLVPLPKSFVSFLVTCSWYMRTSNH